jgi:hypothetical protein
MIYPWEGAPLPSMPLISHPRLRTDAREVRVTARAPISALQTDRAGETFALSTGASARSRSAA